MIFSDIDINADERHRKNLNRRTRLAMKNFFRKKEIAKKPLGLYTHKLQIIIIITSYAPIFSKIKLSGATKPRG